MDNCKTIPLTQGKRALVDEDMYDELSQHKWNAYKDRNTWYAKRGRDPAMKMHRAILGLTPGDGKVIDHRNRNGLDNRRDNLRITTTAVNVRNHGGYRNNTSGHVGVYWNKGNKKWQASVSVNGKNVHLGYHENIQDAVKARKNSPSLNC